jgi:hypothetical protein
MYCLSDQELALHGVKRYIADKSLGSPDRIEMRDASVGEELLLLNHYRRSVGAVAVCIGLLTQVKALAFVSAVGLLAVGSLLYVAAQWSSREAETPG